MGDVLRDLLEFHTHLLAAFVISPWIYGTFPGFILGLIYDHLNSGGKTEKAQKLLKWSFIGYGYFFALCLWAIATDNFPAI